MTIKPEVYSKGALVRCSGEFRNNAGVLIDPGVVRFEFTKPSGSLAYVYGTDVQLVKDAVGQYHVDLSADQAGVWYYRWESTGIGQAAEDHQFTVAPSL